MYLYFAVFHLFPLSGGICLGAKREKHEADHLTGFVLFVYFAGCVPLVLSFGDGDVREVAGTDVFGTRTDQFVMAVLLEELACPTRDAADQSARHHDPK